MAAATDFLHLIAVQQTQEMFHLVIKLEGNLPVSFVVSSDLQRSNFHFV